MEKEESARVCCHSVRTASRYRLRTCIWHIHTCIYKQHTVMRSTHDQGGEPTLRDRPNIPKTVDTRQLDGAHKSFASPFPLPGIAQRTSAENAATAQ